MTGNTGITGALEQDGATSPVNALAIISNELMETIRNAQLAVEDCVDGRGGSQALLRAGDLLHQARGALQLAETYGAALLVEEKYDPAPAGWWSSMTSSSPRTRAVQSPPPAFRLSRV